MHKKHLLLSVLLCIALCACGATEAPVVPEVAEVSLVLTEAAQSSVEIGVITPAAEPIVIAVPAPSLSIESIPAYGGQASIIVNNNQPFFTDETQWPAGTEYYSELDALGRCGVTYARVSKEIMPAYGEQRGEIGMVKPAGWHTVKYPEVIEDLYLYNRCHLIGWQLSAENDNVCNLTTGTRYLNVEGMLPYENQIADYVRRTNGAVCYRVTPYYIGDELVARGILMEAASVGNDDLRFCVWCYNMQPGVEIDYLTGDSRLAASEPDVVSVTKTAEPAEVYQYILNTNTHKCHLPNCQSVQEMSERNKQSFEGSPEEVKEMGYSACGRCHPF